MTISRKALIVPALLLLFSFSSNAQNRTCVLIITAADGRKISLKAEIADTPASRADGLMFRRILGEDEGMIFVFDTPQMLSFWMRNTYIPLSIAYISGKGLINEIHDMKPWMTASYTPRPSRPCTPGGATGLVQASQYHQRVQDRHQWMHR
jgi:uncharacterized membrane protein (UPF0127 family)